MTNKEHNQSLGPLHTKLRQSAEALAEWLGFFVENGQHARHTMWRRARADGSHIVLEAPMIEAKMHKTDLDEDVACANTAYRKFQAAQQRQETKEAKTNKDDRSLVRDLRKKLFA